MHSSREEIVIYLQSGVGDAHSRRMVAALAEFAHRQTPPWQVRWGPELPLEDLQKQRYQGFIFFYQTLSAMEAIRATGVPTVQVGTDWKPGPFPAVLPDHRAIGSLAVRHFRERLFRDYAFVGDLAISFVAHREEAFRAALEPAEQYHCFALDSADNPNHRGLKDWLLSLPTHTGILGANDYVARRICECCGELGLKIPGQRAILGVDNDEMLILSSPVAFSSIDPGSVEIGRRAGEMLANVMAGRPVHPSTIQVPPVEVVLRPSTDHLATDDEKVAAAARIMREETCGGLKVEDICRRVGLGRRAFEVRFKGAIGRPPEAEMRRIRMERARFLLKSSNKSIQEVGEASGFRDSYYFSAAFKREHGLSPRAWREAQG